MITEVPAAFAKAFGQLAERRVIAVLAKSVAVTLVLFAAAGAGLYLALSRLIESYGYDGEWAGLAAVVLVPVATATVSDGSASAPHSSRPSNATP